LKPPHKAISHVLNPLRGQRIYPGFYLSNNDGDIRFFLERLVEV
jgi:hypothetical protein